MGCHGDTVGKPPAFSFQALELKKTISLEIWKLEGINRKESQSPLSPTQHGH
jgi:hypothetical protein